MAWETTGRENYFVSSESSLLLRESESRATDCRFVEAAEIIVC